MCYRMKNRGNNFVSWADMRISLSSMHPVIFVVAHRGVWHERPTLVRGPRHRESPHYSSRALPSQSQTSLPSLGAPSSRDPSSNQSPRRRRSPVTRSFSPQTSWEAQFQHVSSSLPIPSADRRSRSPPRILSSHISICIRSAENPPAFTLSPEIS